MSEEILLINKMLFKQLILYKLQRIESLRVSHDEFLIIPSVLFKPFYIVCVDFFQKAKITIIISVWHLEIHNHLVCLYNIINKM